MTPEVIGKLESIFAIGGSDKESCSYADISIQALYDYQTLHPEFTERKERLKENPYIKARQTIVKALDTPQHAQWFLERKRKIEFAQRSELTGADGEKLDLGVVVLPKKDENTLATPDQTESSPV